MKRWIGLLLLCFLLCGCRREPTMGEQVIVTGIGIDERGGEWIVSVQAVEALKTTGSLSEQSDIATAVYTASGASVAEALQGFLNETGKRTYILQNKMLVVRDTLCERKPIATVLDYFIRNHEGRALVDVVVCRGDPSALLDITTGNDAIPAEYVAEMLEEGNRFSSAVQTRLLDVQRASSGMYDLVAPIMEVSDRTPRLMGTAVFRDGRLCSTLTSQETMGYCIVSGQSRRCLYTVEETTFRVEGLRTRREIVTTKTGWQHRFRITGTADIVEGDKRETRDLLTRVETALAAETEAVLDRVVNRDGCDPLGLARQTASFGEREISVSVSLSLRDK